MDISVTEFKHRCLEIIREIERTRRGIAITPKRKVAARLQLIYKGHVCGRDQHRNWVPLQGRYHAYYAKAA